MIIVSNNEMHKKLKNIIEEKSFVKKVITFDEIQKEDYNLNKIFKKNI